VTFPNDGGLLYTELDELSDGFGRPSLRPRFERAAKENQCDDHRGRVEEERRSGEERYRGVAERGERADGNQRVHVRAERPRAGQRRSVKLSPEPELDRRREQCLEPPAPLPADPAHGEN
jgi:hypothetical protein